MKLQKIKIIRSYLNQCNPKDHGIPGVAKVVAKSAIESEEGVARSKFGCEATLPNAERNMSRGEMATSFL
jgi:hypothetical protein